MTFSDNLKVSAGEKAEVKEPAISETASSVIRLSADWKNLFAARILSRGYDYYLEDRVWSLSQDGNIVTAVVEGSEDYSVRIKLNGSEVSEMDCDCPYAEDGDHCKHEAAVLYRLEDALKENAYAADEADTDQTKETEKRPLSPPVSPCLPLSPLSALWLILTLMGHTAMHQRMQRFSENGYQGG